MMKVLFYRYLAHQNADDLVTDVGKVELKRNVRRTSATSDDRTRKFACCRTSSYLQVLLFS